MTGYKAFVRWTKKNQRLIFYILIAIIAIGFGVTGPMIQYCSGSKKQTFAGMIFGEYIKRSDYNGMLSRWQVFMGPGGPGRGIFFMLGSLEDICEFDLSQDEAKKAREAKLATLKADTPEDEKKRVGDVAEKEALTKKIQDTTWNIVILHTQAAQNGIMVSNVEIGDALRMYGWIIKYRYGIQGGGDISPDQILNAFASDTRMSKADCLETLREGMMIEKYLRNIRDSITVPMDEVFQRYVKNNTSFTLMGAGFHRQDYAAGIDVSSGEISKYYETNKDKFKTPEKYKLQYLFAEKEKFRATVPEPDEAELKKIYEEGKTSGRYKLENTEEKKDDAGGKDKKPGEEAPKFKAFDEVKGDIKKEFMDNAVKIAARKPVGEIERRITAKLDEIEDFKVKNPGNPNVPVIAFEKLAEGVPDIAFNATPFLTYENLDELEKELGNFGSFKQSLQSSFVVGEVSQTVDTDKGFIIFKLLEKMPSELPPFTAGIAAAVKTEIIKEKSRELARKAAEEFMKDTVEKFREVKTTDDTGNPLTEEAITGQKRNAFQAAVGSKGLTMKSFHYKREKESSITDIADNDSEAFKTTVDAMKEGELAVAKTKDPSLKDMPGTDPDIFYVVMFYRSDLPAPTYDEFDKQSKDLRNKMKEDKWKDYWTSYWAALRKEAGLENYVEDFQPGEAPGLPDTDF